MDELQFWLQRLLTHNGLAISSRETQVDVLLWSDASDVGWGGEVAGVAVNAARELDDCHGVKHGRWSAGRGVRRAALRGHQAQLDSS